MSELRPRVIPILLVHRGGLVKTTRFAEPRYLGDPVNAVWIFNEKLVDEITVFDIDASVERRGPDFVFIEQFASECFIPLCYGGGVTRLQEMERLFRLGVEKVSLNSLLAGGLDFVFEAAQRFGSQAIVATMDVRRGRTGDYEVCTVRGTKPLRDSDPVAHARRLAEAGVGEIVVQSIDRDGTMSGYDLELVRAIASVVKVPVVAAGGARDVEDLAAAVVSAGAAAAAAGALFVFGRRRGILINVPDEPARARAFAAVRAQQEATAS